MWEIFKIIFGVILKVILGVCAIVCIISGVVIANKTVSHYDQACYFLLLGIINYISIIFIDDK